jgi:flagellar motility protein MotE (MotC chaperone)
MSNLDSIKQDIRSLNADELSKLSDWLEVNRSVLLDSEIDIDARMGKLVKVTEQVLADHWARRTEPH